MTPTEWKEAQLAKPDIWESILGAVARGWCYEENANKTMDSELAVAIAKEVHALYTTPPTQQSCSQRQCNVKPWVSLENEQIKRLYEDYGIGGITDYEFAEFVRALDLKLRELNEAPQHCWRHQ